MQTSKEFNKSLIGLQGTMLGFALKLTADREAANDLAQETNLKTLNNRDKFKDNLNFKGWVLKIMHNLFVNNYHKNARTKTVIDRTDNLYYLNLPQDSGLDNPDGACACSEINNRMNNLKDQFKTPFSMHLDGYKYDEIAEGIGVPLGTVKSRIFSARKELQITLADYKQ